MKRIFVLLPVVAALGGCGAGGWLERTTGLTPAQQGQIGQAIVAGLKTTPCLIAAGAPAGSYVSTDAEIACRAGGGTPPVR